MVLTLQGPCCVIGIARAQLVERPWATTCTFIAQVASWADHAFAWSLSLEWFYHSDAQSLQQQQLHACILREVMLVTIYMVIDAALTLDKGIHILRRSLSL